MNWDKNCRTCYWNDSFSWDCITDHEEPCEYWKERENENKTHEESCECWEERNELEAEK